MKRIFATLVAALMGVALVSVPAQSTSVYDAVVMEDGSVRHDFSAGLSYHSQRLGLDNLSPHELLVRYYDPTYGDQSVRIPPWRGRLICADPAYAYDIHVTYRPGTAQEVSGVMSSYFIIDSGNRLERARADLKRAKKQLTRARASYHKSRKAYHRSKVKRASAKAKVQRKLAKVKELKVDVRSYRAEVKLQEKEFSACLPHRRVSSSME